MLDKRRVMINRIIQVYPDYDNSGVYIYWYQNKPFYIGKGTSQTLARRIPEGLSQHTKFGGTFRKIADFLGCDTYHERYKVMDWIEANLTISVIPYNVHKSDGEVDKVVEQQVNKMEDDLLAMYNTPLNIKNNQWSEEEKTEQTEPVKVIANVKTRGRKRTQEPKTYKNKYYDPEKQKKYNEKYKAKMKKKKYAHDYYVRKKAERLGMNQPTLPLVIEN